MAMRVVSMSRRVASWSCRASSKRLTHTYSTDRHVSMRRMAFEGLLHDWASTSRRDLLHR